MQQVTAFGNEDDTCFGLLLGNALKTLCRDVSEKGTTFPQTHQDQRDGVLCACMLNRSVAVFKQRGSYVLECSFFLLSWGDFKFVRTNGCFLLSSSPDVMYCTVYPLQLPLTIQSREITYKHV